MKTEILIPKLAVSMEKGTITEWLVADGMEVREGTPIYSLEMEKSVQDVDAPSAGVIRILAPAGAEYDVGVVVAEIQS